MTADGISEEKNCIWGCKMVTLRITDKKIPLDSSLVQKFDLLIDRITRKKPKSDSVITVEGAEGIGKTTMSILIAYYVHHITGKPFSDKNVFSETKEAIEFAQNTEEQIIIFDEPALDVLSAEWWKEVQKDLIKLLMLSRKKRHFMIFNITKFYKFPEYLVVDRASCMVHLYENQSQGRPYFAYIGKDFLENLYNDFRRKRERNYRKYSLFTSHFPDVLDPEMSYNILDHFNLEEYEKRKDKAILSIGKKFKNPDKELKRKLANIKIERGKPIMSQKELAKRLGIPLSTIKSWKEEEIKQ
ncbi:MAG TPA: hypothetical protein VGB37_05285 [Candidatus Lokiarchaeia archaeon]